MNNIPKDPKVFVDYIRNCRQKSMTETEIARSLGLKTSEYRKIFSESMNAIRRKGRPDIHAKNAEQSLKHHKQKKG